MINTTGIKIEKLAVPKSETKKINQQTQPKEVEQQKTIHISSEYAIAALGIHKPAASAQKQQTNEDVKQYIKNLSFAEKISPEDKRSLEDILKKNNEETDYMNKMINLINENKVNPYAVSHLCSHGQMSDLAKGDIDIYFDKVKGQNMSVEDAFVPQHKTQAEGQKAVNPGDVFRVEGQEKIYIKSGDDYSRQLDMDAKTYIKLFPPVERYSSTQGYAGDCYLLSSINSVMENPYARAALYDCFSQNENGVSVQTYDGKVKINCPDCKLPDNADKNKYVEGAPGIQLLEHLYGINCEKQKIDEYSKIMTKEISKLEKKLERCQNNKVQGTITSTKEQELTKKIEKYKQNYNQVKEAVKDPSHKLTFVLDDNEDFIMGKFGPIFEDCDKLHSAYKFPSDYYRGANGGYMENALDFLGFPSETYDTDFEEEEIDEALFSDDTNAYIITASTPSASEKEGVEVPVETSYSIYSWHVYKVQPYDDENGERMFKITNPWNQSRQVVMDESMLKEYFSNFSFTSVK